MVSHDFGVGQGLVLGDPFVPERVVAVFVEQRAEKRIAGQPAHVVLDEGLEFVRDVGAGLEIDGLELDVGVGQNLELELLDLAVGDGTALQLRADIIGDHLGQHFRQQAGHLLGRDGEINRIDRHGADRVVGAVVVAGLVDGEDLEQAELLFRAEGDRLAHGLGVADAQVVVVTQGKHRQQRAGQTWVSGFGHKRGEYAGKRRWPQACCCALAERGYETARAAALIRGKWLLPGARPRAGF